MITKSLFNWDCYSEHTLHPYGLIFPRCPPLYGYILSWFIDSLWHEGLKPHSVPQISAFLNGGSHQIMPPPRGNLMIPQILLLTTSEFNDTKLSKLQRHKRSCSSFSAQCSNFTNVETEAQICLCLGEVWDISTLLTKECGDSDYCRVFSARSLWKVPLIF